MTECKFAKVPENAYHYTMCGLDYVYLTNGYEKLSDPDYGESIIIHNAEKLHTEIGKNIVKYKEKLTAQEVRFLRGMLDLTQSELANQLELNIRTVQRWESYEENHAPEFASDSWIRIMFWDKFIGGNEKATELLKKIRESREHYEYLSFIESQEDWALDNQVA